MVRSLQTSRGIAALLVVLFHLGGTFAQDKYFGASAFALPFAWGDAGVEFFFVLSGYLITSIHRRDFGQPRRLGRYITKRTVRIYPTYWIVCFVVTLAAVAFPTLRQALPSHVDTYLAGLTLVPLDPAVVGGTGSPILFVAWSLQYEMVFYAIVAVAILNRWAGYAVVAALLLSRVAFEAGVLSGFPANFLCSNLVLLFGLGVLVAYAAPSAIDVRRPGSIAAAAAIGFVAFGLLEVAIGRDQLPVDRRLVFGILAALIVFGLVRAEAVHTPWLPIGRFGDLLGDSSYALYLVHIPIISVLAKLGVAARLGGTIPLFLAYVAIVAACVGIAIAFHLFVEKPVLDWLGARLATRRKAEPMPVRPTLAPGEGLR
jgi:exopolysaccharide production protein ExoZ